jgi:riboflavin transporter FmnP
VAFIEFLSVSDTGVYGLIMNALSSSAFCVTCGLFYKYRRTFSGAIWGASLAVVVMTAIMLVANWFITPYYMGVPASQVATMIPTLLLPFNLIKGAVNMGITLIIYKPLTAAFKKAGLLSGGNYTDKKKFIVLTIFSIIVVTVCVLVILFLFDGQFQIFG